MAQATALNITRRSLTLAGLSALVGAAVPAGAVSSAGTSLFEEHWHEHERLASVLRVAYEHYVALSDALEVPPRPAELIVRRRDRMNTCELQYVEGAYSNDGLRRFTYDDVERLRARKAPLGRDVIVDKATGATEFEVDHYLEQRADEVVATSDRWRAECKRLMEPSDQANEAFAAASSALWDHDMRLLALPATTLAEIAIKARVIRDQQEWNEREDLVDLDGQLVDEIEALAPQLAGAAPT